MGNAFLVTKGRATYHYKLAYDGDYVDAESQFTLPYDDSLFNIKWPIDTQFYLQRLSYTIFKSFEMHNHT